MLLLPIIIYKKAKLFRRNHVIIGKPIELIDFFGEELNDQTVISMETYVRDKMIELQKELTEIVLSKKKSRKEKR